MHAAALDVGTGGFHAAVYSDDGRLAAEAYQIIRYSAGNGEALEFDPESLFDSGVRLLSSVVDDAEIPAGESLVLAFTSQRHGSVFLDSNHRPVLAVANLDGRVGRDHLSRVEPHRSEIFRISGRTVSGVYPAMRLSWMSEHDPGCYRQISSFLMINEWFSFRITGNAVSEKTSISESLLFDIRAESWSDRLVELFHQEQIEQWQVVPPGTIVGKISREIADAYSLPEGAHVSLGPGDTQCAAVGTHAFAAGDIVAVNGSTTPVIMVIDRLMADPLERIWTDLYVDGLYLLEGNAGKTGMVYRGICESMGIEAPTDPSMDAIYEADRLSVGAVLVPDPWKPTDFLGSLHEVSIRSRPERLAPLMPYLMLENTAFGIAAKVEELTRAADRGPRDIYLTGGSSRSRLTQLIVSVLLEQYSLHLTSTLDTTAKGLAMIALAGAQAVRSVRDTWVSEEDMGAPLRFSHRDTGVADLIRARYEQWKDHIRRLSGNEGSA